VRQEQAELQVNIVGSITRYIPDFEGAEEVTVVLVEAMLHEVKNATYEHYEVHHLLKLAASGPQQMSEKKLQDHC
jgi:hypothetical protein